MFRLTRQVRFAVNGLNVPSPDDHVNGYAGFPTLTPWGIYLGLDVTLAGNLESTSGYLRNIRDVDQAVRHRALPIVRELISMNASPETVLRKLSDELRPAWPIGMLQHLRLHLSPFIQLGLQLSEPSMIHLSQKFEFSASHRLHNPALSDAENLRVYGKCNNCNGHGHNYELQVTLAGPLSELPMFERIVAETVIDRFDHKNLNVEVPEFRTLIPSVENIAQVIYRLLKPALVGLTSVTVWETPKTWCEYSE